jgi:hypothetical protein
LSLRWPLKFPNPLSDPVVEVIRRELKRVSPDVKIDLDQIRSALASEVLKREVMEGEKAEEARKKIAKSAKIALRTVASKSAASAVPTSVATPAPTEDEVPSPNGSISEEPVSTPAGASPLTAGSEDSESQGPA